MGASSFEADLSFTITKNCCQIMKTPFIESCENGLGERGEEGETVRRSNNNNLIMSHHHH